MVSITVTFTGESVQAVAGQAKSFADVVLGSQATNGEEIPVATVNESIGMPQGNWWGYRPPKIRGFPEHDYAPVDDGTEWDTSALQAWFRNCTWEGQEVIKILAENEIIDPRHEYKQRNWNPNTWSGRWNGVRRAAARVRQSRGLHSWPWGHTYYEPRRLWMQHDIAQRVLDIQEELLRQILPGARGKETPNGPIQLS